MKKFFYDAVYLIPLCAISVLWMAPYAVTNLPKAVITLIPLVVALIGLALLHLPARGKIILAGVLVPVIGVAILISPKDFKETLLSENVWALLFPLIAAAAFGFGFFITRFRVSRIVLAVLLFAGLAVTLTGYQPKKAVVGFVFFYIICVLIEEVQTHWMKSGETEHKSHLVYVAPFLCLFFVMFLIFPNSKKPYEWKFVRQLYHVAAKQIDIWQEQLSKSDSDGMGDEFIGFSEFGRIGGKIQGNDQAVMELTVGTSSSVYLGGKSFDSFDGKAWKKTYKGKENDNLMDTTETLTAITDGSGGQFPEYCKYTYLDVKFLDYKTKHVFMPSKSAVIELPEKGGTTKTKGGDYYFDTTKRYDDVYRVKFYRLYRDNPDFDAFATADRVINDKKWEYTLNRFDFADFEGNSFEDYHAYKQRMKDVYLPKTAVSERMDAYLNELLEGAENDVEKLNRIEAMLSSMDYTKNPGDLPAGIDSASEYLDYFVFEKKEGYCVHYATAFVLLARHEGIPARYVQGYRVKPKRKGYVRVYESDAHAWPECYIEGVGWIVYEPTPGHKADDYEDVLKEREEFAKPGEEIVTDGDLFGDLDEEPQEEEVKRHIDAKYVLLPIAAAVFVVLLLLAIDWIINRIRYSRMKEDEKYRYLVRRNLKILAILGYPLLGGETLEEYRYRLLKEKIEEQNVAFLAEFEEYLYKGDAGDGSVNIVALERNEERLSEIIKKAGFVKRIQLLGLRWSIK